MVGGKAVRPSGSASAFYLDANFPSSPTSPAAIRHYGQIHKKIPSSDESVVQRRRQIRTATLQTQRNPADHSSVVARYPNASSADVGAAIESALAAKREWENVPFVDRAAVFLKAAELVSRRYRYELMAATMVGQGKNAWQAEIDAAAEVCDFFRYALLFFFLYIYMGRGGEKGGGQVIVLKVLLTGSSPPVDVVINIASTSNTQSNCTRSNRCTTRPEYGSE